MKIALLMKRTPNTDARIKPADDGARIDPQGVEHIISAYDEFAIEAAMQLVEGGTEATVTLVTLGPDAAGETIRKGLAMGCDNALHVVGDAETYDPTATGRILAETLRDGGWDLVLAGKQAVDDDACAVPHVVAHELGLPVVTHVIDFTVEDGAVRARREGDGAQETVTAPLPCVLAMTKGHDEPRRPNLKGIMQAKKKPLETLEPAAVDATVECADLTPPPPRPEGRIVGEGVEAVPDLVDALRNEAKVI